MIAAIEVLLWRTERRRTDMPEVFWRHSAMAARREAAGCDVLLFGDSLIKYGLAPPVFESDRSLRTYNLAAPGGPPAASEILLRRALEAGARPRAVVVDFELIFFSHTVWDFATIWPEFIGLRDCWDLSWTARDPEFFAATTLRMLLPSVRDRYPLRARIVGLCRGPAPVDLPRRAIERHRRNWSVNRGAELLPTSPDFAGTLPPEGLFLTHLGKEGDPVTPAATHRFLQVAHRHDITVFVLMPPLMPEVQRIREENSMHSRHVGLLSALADRYLNIVVLDARHAGYDVAQFAEGVHLNRSGAVTLSADVAEIVARRLSGEALPRWISLPCFGPRAVTARTESLNESRTALRELELSGRSRY